MSNRQFMSANGWWPDIRYESQGNCHFMPGQQMNVGNWGGHERRHQLYEGGQVYVGPDGSGQRVNSAGGQVRGDAHCRDVKEHSQGDTGIDCSNNEFQQFAGLWYSQFPVYNLEDNNDGDGGVVDDMPSGRTEEGWRVERGAKVQARDVKGFSDRCDVSEVSLMGYGKSEERELSEKKKIFRNNWFGQHNDSLRSHTLDGRYKIHTADQRYFGQDCEDWRRDKRYYTCRDPITRSASQLQPGHNSESWVVGQDQADFTRFGGRQVNYSYSSDHSNDVRSEMLNNSCGIRAITRGSIYSDTTRKKYDPLVPPRHFSSQRKIRAKTLFNDEGDFGNNRLERGTKKKNVFLSDYNGNRLNKILKQKLAEIEQPQHPKEVVLEILLEIVDQVAVKSVKPCIQNNQKSNDTFKSEGNEDSIECNNISISGVRVSGEVMKLGYKERPAKSREGKATPKIKLLHRSTIKNDPSWRCRCGSLNQAGVLKCGRCLVPKIMMNADNWLCKLCGSYNSPHSPGCLQCAENRATTRKRQLSNAEEENCTKLKRTWDQKNVSVANVAICNKSQNDINKRLMALATSSDYIKVLTSEQLRVREVNSCGLGSRNVDSTSNAGGKFHEVKRGAGWQGRS